jgi:polysaccharide export outer membrane protein
MIRKVALCGGLSLALAIGGLAQEQQPAAPAGSATSVGGGQSAVVIPAQNTGRPQLGHRYRYQVQRSDVFTVTFPLVPEYNQTVTVEPDGYIALQSVGELYVIGDTLTQLTDTIRTAYSKIMHEPVVAINLTDFVKPYYMAMGEVGKPGQYDLRQDITVTQAIALAGGLTHSAKHSSVVLFHRTDTGFVGQKLNIKHLLNSKNLTEDIHVQPGDLIWVPTSIMAKVRPYLPYYGLNAVGYSF